MTDREHDAAREMVRRAHEAVPPPAGFDTAAGLADIFDRAERSAQATPAEGEQDAGSRANTSQKTKAQQAVIDFLLRSGLDGFGRLSPAQASADRALRKSGGDRQKAVRKLIRKHVALAGTQGFVTNLGGLVTLPIAVPANVIAAYLINTHLVGSIAAVHGHDVNSEEVRTGILLCLPGKAGADMLQTGIMQVSRKLSSTMTVTPGGLSAPAMSAKGLPLVGGIVGGGVAAASTRVVGTFARQFFAEPEGSPTSVDGEAVRWSVSFAVERAQRLADGG